jgi:hypothetical protein
MAGGLKSKVSGWNQTRVYCNQLGIVVIDHFDDTAAILNSIVFRKTLWDAQGVNGRKTVECGVTIMYHFLFETIHSVVCGCGWEYPNVDQLSTL